MDLGCARPSLDNPHGTMTGIQPSRQRQRRGRTANFSGEAAEEQVAQKYASMGAKVRERRCRTPEGEIDIVAQVDDILVFVEVKRRKNLDSFDSPVTKTQWRRLESAALHYMMSVQQETGIQPFCRFDVALADRHGQITIIENARSFDAC